MEWELRKKTSLLKIFFGNLLVMKKIYLVILIVVIAGSLLAYLNISSNKKIMPVLSEQTELKQEEKGNFALHLSNQSFAVDPVDIKILIDGKIAANQDFFVDDQHSYTSYRFLLTKGVHKLKIETKKGDATYENSFNITDKHSGIVEYWYYPEKGNNPPTPKHFTFNFDEDKPLRID